MNTPVSLKIAKLLKEKGFDEYCKLCVEDEDEIPLPFDSGNKMHRNSLHPYYSAPIIADVIMWLYEKHGIWIIAPTHDNNDNYFCYEINFKPSHFLLKVVKNKWSPKEIRFNSPTKAYEAAIEYILNNLI